MGSGQALLRQCGPEEGDNNRATTGSCWPNAGWVTGVSHSRSFSDAGIQASDQRQALVRRFPQIAENHLYPPYIVIKNHQSASLG